MSVYALDVQRGELTDLGWLIEESEANGYWKLLLTRAATAIASCGLDREKIWSAVYREAMRINR